MAPLVSPWQAGQAFLACLGLGALTGAARSFGPGRGRAAFLPDFLAVGALLLFLQSYAAGWSSAGSLRWYMAAGGAAGAMGAYLLLHPAVEWALRMLLAPGRRLVRWAAVPAGRLAGWVRQKKDEGRKKRTAKNEKKNLPKERRLLYNSNI